ncbi:hypothetical protein QLZ27_08075, partial [Cronobacter malonaticus]
ANTQTEAQFKEWVELPLDQALCAERGPLEDPTQFIRSMNQLLVS